MKFLFLNFGLKGKQRIQCSCHKYEHNPTEKESWNELIYIPMLENKKPSIEFDE
jgi:hypothetical protein